jgi:carbon storage regulator
MPQRAEPSFLIVGRGDMLVLSRKASQQVMIGTDIRITVVRIDRNQVRLGIEAPAGVAILRDELVRVPSTPAEPGRPEANAGRARSPRFSQPED